ncbi:MAG: hypothetical protein COB04_03325 [Gammaproteobacteria bacterium]|nr:MAG: hypothetical protein COB04_03325 [Gammaproteobacteria bacterium]
MIKIKKGLLAITVLVLLVYVTGEYKPARYYSLLCVDTSAAESGEWNDHYDGYIIGANGCLYDPAIVSINDVPSVVSASSQETLRTPIWYVNGANHRADWVLPEMHLLAENSGRPVVAIYNATLGGRLPDAISDGLRESKVAKTIASQIIRNLLDHQDVYISCNSQGAYHVSKGLSQAITTLSGKFDRGELTALLSKVHVETAGGAASAFPDGPQYIHYVNSHDPVPSSAGVLSGGAQPGADAVIVEFSGHDDDALEPKYRWVGPLTGKFLNVHGFNLYRQYRQPFDATYPKSNPS